MALTETMTLHVHVFRAYQGMSDWIITMRLWLKRQLDMIRVSKQMIFRVIIDVVSIETKMVYQNVHAIMIFHIKQALHIDGIWLWYFLFCLFFFPFDTKEECSIENIDQVLGQFEMMKQEINVWDWNGTRRK